ncbi:hypothetical protein GCM10007047_06680 [Cerasicoccus arenae]|uniref:Uncharacterized protein n=1 Tax=Cerasicoccus arenae TaxID=424488 RepID=A0A8J3GCF0_9BACT|nr:hypothetical protein GCM10007047_06680 [Cerasicoccus arenae]
MRLLQDLSLVGVAFIVADSISVEVPYQYQFAVRGDQFSGILGGIVVVGWFWPKTLQYTGLQSD